MVYRIIPKEKAIWRNLFLFISSLFFYSWGQPKGILLLLFCVIANYVFGLLINKKYGSGRRIILIFSIILNIFILFYYKYINFSISTLNSIFNIELKTINTIAPIGISFFTFKAISYLIDIYKGKQNSQKNIINIGLYISFFPHIMSGPIVQYDEMASQIISSCSISKERTAYGIKRFIYGMSKKVLIANQLGSFVDAIMGMNTNQVPGSWYWLVMLCYTLQIYYDFSGYSDMAIGLGEMFGLSVKENFNYPYLSCSLREFWRRWHMSLNRWFQNYLYIPLGGSKKGNFRTMLNLSIVFLLTGLWHGANFTFIVWGLWHGCFMLLERTKWGEYLEKPEMKLFSRIYTLLVVALGWLIFRSDNISEFINIFHSMITFSQVPAAMPLALYLRPHIIAAIIIAIIICGPLQKMVSALNYIILDRTMMRISHVIYLILIFLFSLLVCISGTYAGFIYFKF